MRREGATALGGTPVQMAAFVVGAVFLLVGILGFVPGITSDFGDLKFAGTESEAKLLGLFQVSILHNIVHLLFGYGIIASRQGPDASRTFLIGAGAIYLLLAVYGLFVGNESSANFVPINNADDVLHLVLAAGMLALGFILGRGEERTAVTT